MMERQPGESQSVNDFTPPLPENKNKSSGWMQPGKERA